jgi:hypothetical protein
MVVCTIRIAAQLPLLVMILMTMVAPACQLGAGSLGADLRFAVVLFVCTLVWLLPCKAVHVSSGNYPRYLRPYLSNPTYPSDTAAQLHKPENVD